MKPLENTNITLSLPKELLRRVKIIAVSRGQSVSGLLARMLEDLVRQEDSYGRAREEHLALLEEGWDLGTEGRPAWTRAELHER